MTRAADVANFTSGIGSASSPTTIGTGFTVTNSGDVRVGGALTANNLNVSGIGTITTLNSTSNTSTWAQVGSGLTFTTGIGTNLNISGIATVGNLIKVGSGITIDGGSGIISATSLYVNGAPFSSGVGISTLGGVVGTGITSLVFRGSGISTVRASAGIATINVEGGAVGFNKINYIFN